jgi:hypothetical protein
MRYLLGWICNHILTLAPSSTAQLNCLEGMSMTRFEKENGRGSLWAISWCPLRPARAREVGSLCHLGHKPPSGASFPTRSAGKRCTVLLKKRWIATNDRTCTRLLIGPHAQAHTAGATRARTQCACTLTEQRNRSCLGQGSQPMRGANRGGDPLTRRTVCLYAEMMMITMMIFESTRLLCF